MVKGLGGDDNLIGGPGGDEIQGGSGIDVLAAADGEIDRSVSGGGGDDLAYAGPRDVVRSARRLPPPAPDLCPCPVASCPR